MDAIQSFYLSVFIWAFKIVSPLFMNPVLVSYCVIFLLFLAAAVYLFKWLKRKKNLKKKGSTLWTFYGLCVAEIILIGFLLWYVLIHFSTYKLIM